MLSHFSHVWLCDHMNCSPQGSSVRGILQTRIMGWGTIPSPIYSVDIVYLLFIMSKHLQTDRYTLGEGYAMWYTCTMYAMSMCCAQSFSHVQPFVTPWTVAQQVPLSTEFSRQEYWSGLPFPSPMMSIYYDKYTWYGISLQVNGRTYYIWSI